MSPRRLAALVMLLSLTVSGPAFAGPTPTPPPPPDPPPASPPGETAAPSTSATPPRLSYLTGSVTFWRPGAQDWSPAALNTPLAPGDVLSTGQGGHVEIQVGPRAFVRMAQGTQLGLDNHEADFVQFRVTAGHAAVDARGWSRGSTIELATPGGAFTIDRPGYYRVDVSQEGTSFAVHGTGHATVTSAGGAATSIAAGQRVVIGRTDTARVDVVVAPPPDAWDQWNSARTDQLLRAPSASHVPSAVYGAEALEQHGSWRVEDTYGPVWVPASVPAGWVPYSTGRWIWDPRFGWTWLDDAPWGWAPYHYGRWVFVRNAWAWTPGPVIVRPVYAPALVVFLGGVTVGRPLCWAPLGWGEPVIPWWGRRGFVGIPTWASWGGPRIVNNVIVNRTTMVNVQHISVYRHVSVTNAVLGVSAAEFGRGAVRPARVNTAEAQQLTPVRGALGVRPVAASVAPAMGSSVSPPAAIQARPVVATRAAHDPAPTLHAAGLPATSSMAPDGPVRLVPAPARRPIPAGGTAPGAASDREHDDARRIEPRRAGDGHRSPALPPSRAAIADRRDGRRGDAPRAPAPPTAESAPGEGGRRARLAPGGLRLAPPLTEQTMSPPPLRITDRPTPSATSSPAAPRAVEHQPRALPRPVAQSRADSGARPMAPMSPSAPPSRPVVSPDAAQPVGRSSAVLAPLVDRSPPRRLEGLGLSPPPARPVPREPGGPATRR